MSEPADPKSRRGPWTVRGARPIYDNPWISVVEYDVLNPKGGPGIYGEVGFKNLALGVVPIDHRGWTVLVGQHRFPLDLYSWEIPEGGGDPALDPQHSVARELAEETGLAAAHYAEILRLHLSNAVSDEAAILYLAWDLTPGPAHPEDTELLALRWLPLDEAVAMAVGGAITDAMSVAALLAVDRMRRTGAWPDGFDPALRAVLAP